MSRSPEKLRVTAEVVSLRASHEMGRTVGKTIRVLLRAGRRVQRRNHECTHFLKAKQTESSGLFFFSANR